MRRRAPLGPADLRRRLACLAREAFHHLVELLAVLLAEVDLVVPAVKAERAGQMLAARNLFRVVVTCECDGDLLCHVFPPSPNRHDIPARAWFITDGDQSISQSAH